jgi:hypothetical protein
MHPCAPAVELEADEAPPPELLASRDLMSGAAGQTRVMQRLQGSVALERINDRERVLLVDA